MTLKLTGQCPNRREQIMAYLTEFGQRCNDQTIRLGDLSQEGTSNFSLSYVNPKNSMEENELFIFNLSSHAELQLLQRLKVPVSYFHRCPVNLQITQTDHWLHNTFANKEMTFRTIDGNQVRAALTNRYVPMDDLVIFPEILTSLAEARQDLLIRSFYKDNDFTLLRSVYTDLTVISPNDPNRHYWAGIEVRNSETGMSALWISPVIRSGRTDIGVAYDFLDSNKEGGTRLLHVKPKEDRETIDNAIKTALKTAQAAISHLIQMESVVIENPAQELKNFAEITDHVPNRLIDILITEYEHTLQMKKLAFAEVILNAVKDLPVFSKRMAEAEVGRYLNLFEDTDERIDAILENHITVNTSL